MEFIVHLFSAFCGQAPAHTWAAGGELLPCCQRCTGLYAGALGAALFHLLCRPRLTGRFLEVHGVFLLLMVPFGYHWLPQSAVLRAATGVLFGAGLVTFLQLPLLSAARFREWRQTNGGPSRPRVVSYFGGVLLMAMLVPWAGANGAHAVFLGLSLASAGGALILVLLVLGDAALAVSATTQLLSGFGKRKAHP